MEGVRGLSDDGGDDEDGRGGGREDGDGDGGGGSGGCGGEDEMVGMVVIFCVCAKLDTVLKF